MSFPKKHKPSEASKRSSSTKSATRKRSAWKSSSKHMKKKTSMSKWIKSKKAQCPRICLTERKQTTRKCFPTWSSRSARKKQANGKCRCRKSKQWLKLKCFKSWNQASARNSHGSARLIRFALSVIASRVKHRSTRDTFDRLVWDLKKRMSRILN